MRRRTNSLHNVVTLAAITFALDTSSLEVSPNQRLDACLFVVPRLRKTKVLHGGPSTASDMGTISNAYCRKSPKPSGVVMSCERSPSSKSNDAPDGNEFRMKDAVTPPIPQKPSRYLRYRMVNRKLCNISDGACQCRYSRVSRGTSTLNTLTKAISRGCNPSRLAHAFSQ